MSVISDYVLLHRRTRLREAYYAINRLEPRLLLATTFNATSGNDTIVVSGGSNVIDVSINGADHITSDTNIQINALDGNDSIDLAAFGVLFQITVTGGNGNDSITVGDGNYSDATGTVTINDNSSAEGNDTLTIDDSVAGGGQHDTLHISPTQIYADRSGGSDPTINFNSFLENIIVNRSSQDDVVDIDTSGDITGLVVNLGNGNNTINYDPSNQEFDLSGALLDTINGGNGFDQANFYDNEFSTLSNGYQITPTTIEDQLFSGFDSVNLMMRSVLPHEGGIYYNNALDISGNGGVPLISASGGSTIADFSSNGEPVDIDNIHATFTLSFPGYINVIDQDADNSDHAWLFTKDGEDQVVSKGLFTLNDEADVLNVDGGTTNDVFDVADIAFPPGADNALSLHISGGYGDDILQTTNAIGSSNDNNLSKAFENEFSFSGGSGNDTLDLNDSNGQTAGGSSQYLLEQGTLIKNGQTLLTFSLDAGSHLNFLGSSDDDTIDFAVAPGILATISGGAGDDLLTPLSPDQGGSYIAADGNATIYGAAGNDKFLIDTSQDEAAGDTVIISLASNAIIFGSVAPITFTYDSATMETVEIDGNSAASQYNINDTYFADKVSINCNDGNDTVNAGGGDLDSNGLYLVTINGGAGTDQITFNDVNDAYNASETEDYSLNIGQLTKGPVNISFSQFESQQLDVSTNGTGALVPQNVNISAINIPTTIKGTSARATTVNVTTGDLSTIAASLALSLGANATTVFNDQNSSGNTSYTLNDTTFSTSTGHTFTVPTAGIVINANAGDNAIDVIGTLATTAVTINAGAGSDVVTAGDGTIADHLLGPVSVAGSNGSSLNFDDSDDASPATQTLTNTGFTVGSITHSFSGISFLTVLAGPGGDSLNINKATTPFVNFTGNSGDDTVTVGNGNLTTNFTSGNIIVNGGTGGNDTLIINDRSSTTAGNYIISGSTFQKGTGSQPKITISNFETCALDASGGNDTINDTASGLPFILVGNGGVDTFNINAGAGGLGTINPTVTINGGAGLDILNVNTTASSGSAHVVFDTTQDLGALSIAAGGTVTEQLNAGISASATSLTLATTGKLDLNDNAFILNYSGSSPLTTFRTEVLAGYHNGAWNGNEITSTAAQGQPQAAIGFGEASSLFGSFPATFAGQSIDGTCILAKYTIKGDANLDGKVDVTDLGDFASNWQSSGKSFTQGDFSYDGTVDVTDLGIFASNWQKNDITFAAPSDVLPMPSLQSFLSPPPVATRTPVRAASRPVDLLS